jgi:DNA modification methylase
VNVINQTISKSFAMYHGDSCQVIQGIPDNSIDFSIYSPPFSNLYIYSDSVADMGNSANDDEFFEHYKYLIREMHRVTRPGRLSAVHCKDLPLYHNRDGAAGLKDFPGMIIRAHEEAGWTYHSRVTIWKDPVIEMQRTKNHGLLHKNFQARAEVVRQGMADYLIVFRKWEGVEGTESPIPVKQKRKPGDYIGDNAPQFYDSDRDYSIQVWQRYASPVWFDINQTRVLNFQMAREGQDEKHICPLQLDVIERSVDLWTNPGETVLSPFAGIGSEGYCSIKQGRKFIGIELKQAYYEWAARNLKAAEEESQQLDLFSFQMQEQPAD